MQETYIEEHKKLAIDMKKINMIIPPSFILEEKSGKHIFLSSPTDGLPKFIRKTLQKGDYISYLHIAEAFVMMVKMDKTKDTEPSMEKQEVIVVSYSEKSGAGWIETIPYRELESGNIIFDEGIKVNTKDKGVKELGGNMFNLWN